jgi:hypothetical protein
MILGMITLFRCCDSERSYSGRWSRSETGFDRRAVSFPNGIHLVSNIWARLGIARNNPETSPLNGTLNEPFGTA